VDQDLFLKSAWLSCMRGLPEYEQKKWETVPMLVSWASFPTQFRNAMQTQFEYPNEMYPSGRKWAVTLYGPSGDFHAAAGFPNGSPSQLFPCGILNLPKFGSRSPMIFSTFLARR
jgi:hypothetical protein